MEPKDNSKDELMYSSSGELPQQRQSKSSDAQYEAVQAAREALEAHENAQDALNRAFAKQLVAQEKAQQATQQILAQNETANQVAVAAARQAAKEAVKDQKRVSQQLHAHEAAQKALGAFGSAQPGQQFSSNSQGQGAPPALYQCVLPCNEDAVFGQHRLNLHQENTAAHEMLLQAANKVAVEARDEMNAALNLASNEPNLEAQQVSAQLATSAQQKMEFAQQMTASVQIPETTFPAPMSLSSDQPNPSMQLG